MVLLLSSSSLLSSYRLKNKAKPGIVYAILELRKLRQEADQLEALSLGYVIK